ncbi:transcriptional regulator, GntR family with aminotransferase domain protein [Kribbella flavida DSM 17836]|uniref:Transcriptional regulator, GntR family with aminotransferase domain protein n=1 Tax=Kribbella flavida (strain DSM 17836 / JCM 10339 / NBRC 14399) TaxID=479435 RepID=D2PLY4_KRIFD|nr:PLP-dependent aminotransferase family protein [Kribbella flavida]ADB32564.1 transcriptional regulator, GntR family with aminotransferase domain protein [Kribbella flavida DSM 17836]
MHDDSSVAQLTARLRDAVHRYSEGEKLPSSRALVDQYRVSPVTVSRAIAALVAEGIVVSRPGAGVFRAGAPTGGVAGDVSWQEVTLSAHPATDAGDAEARRTGTAGVLGCLFTPPAGVIDFNGGYLHPTLQPERALSAALARAARRPGAWSRPPVEGVAELRDWFARDIGGVNGPLSGSDVLIAAGGQSALTTALRALAVPRAPVLVESPTYPGLLAVARAAGLRPVPVPVDGDGVRTDLLADAFRATGAKAFVCQPLFQNPTGAVLAPQRRAEVLRIARTAGAFVVEDDYARRLVHADSPPLPPPLAADDPDGVVVHVRSLTKPASPSLRIAALSARGPIFERLRGIQVIDSFFLPRPLQETTLELVSAPAWGRHLRSLAAALRDRRVAAQTALRRTLPQLRPAQPVHGGNHLWLRLPDGTDETTVVSAALSAGVAVVAGSPYFAAEAPGPHLRLSFAHTTGVSQVEEGIRRLSNAFT